MFKSDAKLDAKRPLKAGRSPIFRSGARLDAELPLRDGRSPYSGRVRGWALQVWLLAQGAAVSGLYFGQGWALQARLMALGNAMRGTCFQAAHLDFSGNAVHGRAYEPCLAEIQIPEKERLPAPESGASGKAPLFQEKPPDGA